MTLEDSLQPFRDYREAQLHYRLRDSKTHRIMVAVDQKDQVRETLVLSTINRMGFQTALEIVTALNKARQLGIVYGAHQAKEQNFQHGFQQGYNHYKRGEQLRIADARAAGFDAGYSRAVKDLKNRKLIKLLDVLLWMPRAAGRGARKVCSFIWLTDCE